MTTEQFVQAIHAHRRILYKVIGIYCPHEEDQKDLEQEIVIQLWKSFDSYNSNYKLSTWIYRVAMNVAISSFRKSKRDKSATVPLQESIFQAVGEEPDELDDRRRFLHYFMEQLDPLNKEILILYLEDYNYREIADIVGITESNVGTKINRLKTRMKELANKNNKQ
jgi:RNA polymerase sigma-70 factor (ECF subfamily)